MKPAGRKPVSLRLLAVVLVALLAGAVASVWLLTKDRAPLRPMISAYSHGSTARVGPFRYCEVLNLDHCQTSGAQGEVRVTARAPLQLSIDPEIARAPWLLLRVYENSADSSADSSVSFFAPATTLAVTIPTVDPQRGRLTGVVVQLLTLVLNRSTGEVLDVPHAEWSVRATW